MKESLRLRLDQLSDRHEELTALLADVEVISDNKRFRQLSREHSDLSEITEVWTKYKQAEADIETAEAMLSDPDFKEMAVEEIKENKAIIASLEADLNILMIPKDPNDANSAYLEIRAGTGGDEAAIFSGDLYRMYTKYAESQGWRIEVLSENEGEHGGYKEIICLVNGEGVYGRLKFESGAHRVQRVPATESQGRVHTSACTVAILPEVDVDTTVEINAADLRIDTYRASGAGGQHINKTDSAVRITHLPTGIVVECQDDRSQHRNKAQAMSVLAARIRDAQIREQQSKLASDRRSLIGSGDRSERIRTYNYPQGRITDHRINLTLYKIEAITDGDMEELINALSNEHQADLLAGFAED